MADDSCNDFALGC